MLEVTDDAIHYMCMLLDQNQLEEGDCLRLARKDKGRLGFYVVPLNSEGAEDQSFEHEGQTVLIVDNLVGAQLAGMTLDVQRDASGQAALVLVEEAG